MRKTSLLFLVLISSIFILPSIPNKSIDTSREPSLSISSVNGTNFNITEVIISYKINNEGDYTCSISLLIIGKEGDNNKNLTAEFNFTGYSLTNFEFYLQNDPINFVENKSTFFTIISLSLNQTIISDQVYVLTGRFHGFYNSISDDKLKYDIGVDWGTQFIGKQEFNVILDNQIFSPDFQDYFAKSSYQIYLTKYQWVKGPFERSHFLSFKIIKTITPITSFLLIKSKNHSTVEIGNQFNIYLTNNGSIEVDLWIILDSKFSLGNDTGFPIPLKSNKSVLLVFSVNSDAEPETNGSIWIVAEPYNEKINLFFFIKESPPKPLNLIGLSVIFLVISAIASVIIYGYFNQLKIKKFVESLRVNNILHLFNPLHKPEIIKNNYEADLFLEWSKIESRWSSILKENELKVIEFLFYEPEVNQKDIAKGLGFSNMKISRLVTKLEKMQLLFRQPSDIGNLVKLNYERLMH
ncbi:MAG: helix-turn-helix transcriptional regulator [Candidatus Hodarchaeales archaeon]|jgi:hypothetical protein